MKEVKDFLDALSGADPAKVFVAVLFLGLLAAERLWTLRTAWLNFRLGRDELTLEKQRLEVEKLRYEIEALRKTHGLPELAPTPKPLPVRPSGPALVASPAPQPPSARPWDWQIRYPLAATIFLRFWQVVLAVPGAILAFSVVVSPFALLFGDTRKDWQYLLIGWVVNALLAYGCYVGFRRLQRSVVAIRNR